MVGSTKPATASSRGDVKRSRTGCTVCRSRKIKCDEQWPVCGPCNRGHRECQRAPWATFQHQQNPSVETQQRGCFFKHDRQSFEANQVWVDVPKLCAYSMHVHVGDPFAPFNANLISYLGSDSPAAFQSSARCAENHQQAADAPGAEAQPSAPIRSPCLETEDQAGGDTQQQDTTTRTQANALNHLASAATTAALPTQGPRPAPSPGQTTNRNDGFSLQITQSHDIQQRDDLQEREECIPRPHDRPTTSSVEEEDRPDQRKGSWSKHNLIDPGLTSG